MLCAFILIMRVFVEKSTVSLMCVYSMLGRFSDGVFAPSQTPWSSYILSMNATSVFLAAAKRLGKEDASKIFTTATRLWKDDTPKIFAVASRLGKEDTWRVFAAAKRLAELLLYLCCYQCCQTSLAVWNIISQRFFTTHILKVCVKLSGHRDLKRYGEDESESDYREVSALVANGSINALNEKMSLKLLLGKLFAPGNHSAAWFNPVLNIEI